jgi:hypothetical protein
LCKVHPAEIPHNVKKYADNLDIIISEPQSKYLNSLWTENFFSNQERTFFFKLHNNTLGYNNAVAHFVRGHSPGCTFCDILHAPEPAQENSLHLFYECRSVSAIIDTVFKRIYGNDDFLFSRREYFATFERRELSNTKNTVLTLISKMLIKYIWDCKTKFFVPDLENCWDNLKLKIAGLLLNSKKFKKLWEGAGFALDLENENHVNI